MTHLSADLAGRALATHPLPIADAVSALLAAASAHEERDRVVECFRATVRWLSAVALAARVQYGPAPAGDGGELVGLLRALRARALTDGQWVGMLRAIVGPWTKHADGFPVPRLAEIFGGKGKKALAQTIDGLLEMRKSETVAHGATGSADAIEGLLARRTPQLEALLVQLEPVWQAAELVVPLAPPTEAAEPQPTYRLVGATPPRGRFHRGLLPVGVRLPPGEPLLVAPDGKPLVSLQPVALFRRPSPDAIEELFVLDGAHKQAARYVALPSMAEHRELEVWNILGAALLEGGDDEPPPPSVRTASSPYRGLESFGPEHAPLFFGRERQAEALANRIRRRGLVTVTGPSGAGKSSLLRAGALPLLEDVALVVMRPGADPLASLERALSAWLAELARAAGAAPDAEASPLSVPRGPTLGEVLAEHPETLGSHLERHTRPLGARLVLLVDQAEELLTLSRDDLGRHAFAEAIASLGLDDDGPLRVVLSLREDFFARLSTLGPLRGLYNRQVEIVTTPAREELARILVAPASLFQFAFEDGLAEHIVGAVAGEPAALAMLEFCAAQLWERRDRRWKRLTWDAYRSVGGVEGALAAHADATLEALTPAQQAAARAMLLRLCTAERTRAVVERRELVAVGGEEGARVLEALVAARLVVAREGAVSGGDAAELELVHEALVAHWGRLRSWLDDDGELGRVRARVAAAVGRWRTEGERADLLLSEGKPLLEAEELLAARGATLAEHEAAFIRTSQRRARRTQRLKRAAVAGLGGLTALAATFGGLAWVARGRAEDMAQLADDNARTAARSADEAVARAVSLLVEQGRRELLADEPERALVFLREAASRGGKSVALRALLADAARGAELREQTLEAPTGIDAAVFQPGGDLVATGDGEGALRLHDAATGGVVLALPGAGAATKTLSFSADGELIAVATADGQAAVHRLARSPAGVPSIRSTRRFDHGKGCDGAILTAPGDRLLTRSWAGGARLWDVASGAETFHVAGDETHHVARAALAADGRLLAVGLDASTGAGSRVEVFSLDEHGAAGDAPFLVFDLPHTSEAITLRDDGRAIAVSSGHEVRVWQLPDGARMSSLASRAIMTTLAFSPGSGELLATGGYDADVRLWRGGSLAWDAVAHRDDARGAVLTRARVYRLAFDSAAEILVSAGSDAACVWDVSTGLPLAVLRGHEGGVREASFDPRFGRILTLGHDGTVGLFRGTHGRLLGSRPLAPIDGSAPWLVALAPAGDGALVASGMPFGRTLGRRARGGPDAVETAELAYLDGDTGTQRSLGRAVAASLTVDGRRVLAARADSALELVDVHTGAAVTTLGGLDGLASAVAVSPDGTLAAAAVGDGEVRLAPLTSSGVPALQPLDRPLSFVGFSADGRYLAAAGRGIARIYRVADGSTVLTDDGAVDDVALEPRVDFAPDAGLAFVETASQRIAVWDLARGVLARSFSGERARPSPDGRFVVVHSSTKGTAELREASSGALVVELDASAPGVLDALFLPDGERLALAAADGRVRLFEVPSGGLLAVLPGHRDTATALAGDGKRLASFAADGLRLWDVQVETRSAEELARIDVPFELADGRLVPRARAASADRP